MFKIYNHLTNMIENHLVLEKQSYGALSSICKLTKPFEEATAFIIMRQVCEALKVMHDNNIVHLDIKESNILINFDKNNIQNRLFARLPLNFSVSDFGIA